jgi:outer membrane protein, multidrug efflux system
MRKASLLFLLLMGGCVGPNYERPTFPLPNNWKNPLSNETSNTQKINIAWWQNFSDGQLEGLINTAVSNNLDYLTAQARIREARANLMTVEAGLFPTLSGIGSATRSHFGPNVPRNSSSASSVPSSSSSPSLYAAGFDATWEIDIFGGIRRAEESALALMESVENEAQAILISLIAEVAQNYINLRNYQHQLEVMRQIANLWKEYKDLQISLEKAGMSSQITTASAESALEEVLATIPPLEASLKASLHRLGVLLGKDPGAFYDQLMVKGEIPWASETVVAELPSDLILRRPDIRMNERLLASATAQIGISMASLFPHFQLTGSFEFERNKGAGLFSPGSQTWLYGLNFSVPIFDFGKIRSQIDAKYAQKDEALLTYQKSILIALEEVENGLVNFANESGRYHRLKGQLAAQQRIYNLTLSKHQAGLSSFADVIQAKISLLIAQNTTHQSQAITSLNLVALYKALGGGWEIFAKTKSQQNDSNTCA